MKGVVQMAATVKDLAQKTGLSVGTISNYLNNRKVKDENKVLIEEAIQLLDFNMNYTARSLRTKKSNIIGLIIPSMSVTFFSKVTTIIDKYLSDRGYLLMLCTLDAEDTEKQMEKLNRLKENNIDGFIVIPDTDSAVLTEWVQKTQLQKPIIILDKKIESIQDASYVLVNNYEATYDATNFVLGKGHRELGIISGATNNYASRERFRGMIQAIEDSEFRVNTYTVEGNFLKKSGYDACEEILTKKPHTSVLLVLNYDMTLGAIEYLHQNGRVIGEDISIIGYDLLEFSAIIQPSIAIVTQPLDEMAAYTASKLLAAVEGEEALGSEEEIFACKLYENASVIQM